ncbi:MAG: S-adenosylmethionine:tRNA ribosyltransferase-isomerase [Bacteroidetes bacterium]|nr:MAG: S-adenosylmethionine:tRNA ribosyltransferase-isomerase [Bacteroidota bacterium]
MHVPDLSIQDYTYHLPQERIANFPLQERDASKLLVYNNGVIDEDIYKNLDRWLPSGTVLIFNDTKVISARLLFHKPTGGVIEIFCLEPHEHYRDMTNAMMQQGSVLWQCLIGGASKWKHGQVLEMKIRIGETETFLHAKYVDKKIDSFVIEFSWDETRLSFGEILHYAGVIPLPPYIKRQAQPLDAERYQTIYAHHEGSVAAPTAGLHFTDNLLNRLRKNGIQTDFITLHVGAGTFKPVKSATVHGHEMHAEFITVSKGTIQNIIEALGRNVIPVGTTSLRTIESLYWLGVKVTSGEENDLTVSQWEPYELANQNLSSRQALENLVDLMSRKNMDQLTTKTNIMIVPGYKVRVANALITNFHQPQSTLLLLVAALIGNDWKRVYDYALQNDFRFLSYGDGCLLWVNR